jgi:hypothetical protein
MVLDFYDMDDDEDEMKIGTRILLFLVVFLFSMFYHFLATKTRREL